MPQTLNPIPDLRSSYFTSGGFDVNYLWSILRGEEIAPFSEVRLWPETWNNELFGDLIPMNDNGVGMCSVVLGNHDPQVRSRLVRLASLGHLIQNGVRHEADRDIIMENFAWAETGCGATFVNLHRGVFGPLSAEAIDDIHANFVRIVKRGGTSTGAFGPLGEFLPPPEPAPRPRASLTVSELKHCCAGRFISAWGHGDPDEYNDDITVEDIRRFHEAPLRTQGSAFQLAVFHDYQLDELRGVLGELGWVELCDLPNRAGDDTLTLWKRVSQ